MGLAAPVVPSCKEEIIDNDDDDGFVDDMDGDNDNVIDLKLHVSRNNFPM